MSLCQFCKSPTVGQNAYCNRACKRSAKAARKANKRVFFNTSAAGPSSPSPPKLRKRERPVSGLLEEQPVSFDTQAVDSAHASKLQGQDDPNLELDLEEEQPVSFDTQAVDSASKKPIPVSAGGRKMGKYQPLSDKETQKLIQDATSTNIRETASTQKHLRTAEACFRKFLGSLNNTSFESFSENAAKDQNYLENILLAWVHASLYDGNGEGPTYHPMYSRVPFRDTYIPHLLKFLEKSHLLTSEDAQRLRKVLVQKVNLMTKHHDISKSQMPQQKGANPLLTGDLEHMINNTPAGFLSDREDIFAWLAFCLATGQRGISCSNLCWGDLSGFHSEKGYWQFTVLFRRTKGDYAWCHKQKLEGKLETPGANPLYWLDLAWKQTCNSKTASIVTDDLENSKFSKTFVFRCGKPLKILGATEFRECGESEYYRRQLEKIAVYNGYPPGFFTNHSTRSGMQITAYINLTHGKNAHTSEGAWKLIELYIGYSPKAQNQITYFKNNFQLINVLCRALDLNHLDDAGSVMAMSRFVVPKDFHELKTLEPQFQPGDNWNSAKRFLFTFINENLKSSPTKAQFKSLVRKLANHVDNEEEGRFDKIRKKHSQLKLDNNKCLYELMTIRAERKRLKQRCPHWLTFGSLVTTWGISRFLEDWASEFKPRGPEKKPRKERKMMKSGKLSLRVIRKEEQEKLKNRQVEERRAEVSERQKQREKFEKKPNQVRSRWTDDETRLLCKGVVEHGPRWTTIALSIPSRNDGNCKDRIRTLGNMFNIQDPREIAQAWLDNNEV